MESIVSQLNIEVSESKLDSETIDEYKKIINKIKDYYFKIKTLLSMVDSSSQTEVESENNSTMASAFDIKTAISLLPVMNGQEEVTKQLIDGILLYSTLITEETKSQLIDFVLKTRLSSSAKLRLKSSYSSVSNLVKDIRSYLLPKKSAEAIQTQLFRAKQGRRSIEAYGTELEELFVNLTLAQSDEDSSKYEVLRPINEKTAIKRFADGLSDPRLSTIIAARQFSSLPEAIRVALDENSMSTQQTEQVMQYRSTTFNDRGNRGYYKRGSYGQTNRTRNQHNKTYQNNYSNNKKLNNYNYTDGNRGQRTTFVNSNYTGNMPRGSRQQSRSGGYGRGRARMQRIQHTTREADAPETDLRNQFFRT